MTRRHPPYIAQRRPVYIGCEGASEASYARFLEDLVRKAGLPVHLVVDELAPGAGDPLARVEMAINRLTHLRRTRTSPADRFLLLDHDQVALDRNRAQKAQRLAADKKIIIIWQDPCFEAVLLRHLDGRTGHRPPDTLSTERALVRDWPEYKKPMTRTDLAKRLNLQAVLRAASVEPGLETLLRCIGLL